jgi:hypothetical protein
MRDLYEALERLNDLIDGGMEFPDACGKVAREEGVDYDALRNAYDEQFA